MPEERGQDCVRCESQVPSDCDDPDGDLCNPCYHEYITAEDED